jgi:ABC-type lipoprotein release transport system permease subunit
MAWRNVGRNRRRSGVTVAAMCLALVVMILYSGFMEWYLGSMEHTILDLEVGDIQIFAEDYREDPSIYTRIRDPEALFAPLEAAGFPAAGRLLAFGLAAVDEASAGASFRGVDVERDALVSQVAEQIASGEWLDPADPKGVVVGRRLARTLGVELGSELLAITQGADAAMAYELYHVRGVLNGISDATDRTGVFMTQAAFRELLVLPDGVHQIIVRRPPELELGEAVQLVQAAAGELDVRTWRQLLPTLASLLDSARGAMVAVSLILYIAVAILILNAMLMAVFERVREFGVLKALGVEPRTVLALIAIESAIQTGIAIAVGLLLATPGLLYLERVGVDIASLAGISVMGIAMDPIWRAAITPSVFMIPIGMLVSIVAIAVVYPALKAALIRPVEAMRYH